MATIPEMNAIRPILEACEDPVIFDLGAHEGFDSEWMVRACKRPPYLVQVEPDNSHILKLIEMQRTLCRGVIFYAAISDHDGVCDFYECHTSEGRGSGSIRRPTGHLERNGIKYDFEKREVSCLTLDSIFLKIPELTHIDMLWVDIQAAERDMIAGGQETLKRTRYMFIEAEDGPEMYEGQFMRNALLGLLPGWRIIGDFDFNLLLVNDAFDSLPKA